MLFKKINEKGRKAVGVSLVVVDIENLQEGRCLCGHLEGAQDVPAPVSAGASPRKDDSGNGCTKSSWCVLSGGYC